MAMVMLTLGAVVCVGHNCGNDVYGGMTLCIWLWLRMLQLRFWMITIVFVVWCGFVFVVVAVGEES